MFLYPYLSICMCVLQAKIDQAGGPETTVFFKLNSKPQNLSFTVKRFHTHGGYIPCSKNVIY